MWHLVVNGIGTLSSSMMRLSLVDSGNSEEPIEPGTGGSAGIEPNGSAPDFGGGELFGISSKSRRFTTDWKEDIRVVGVGGVDGLLNASPE